MDMQQPITSTAAPPAAGTNPLARPFKLSRRFDRTGRLLGDSAMVDGSVVFVTSAFGMNAAGVVVRRLASAHRGPLGQP